MKLAFAFFAEHVQMTQDGRVNILGADVRVLGGVFPLAGVSLALVVKFLFSSEDEAVKHAFSAEFHTPDDEKMEPLIRAEFSHPEPPPPEDKKAAFTLVLTLNGLAFPKPGVYTFPMTLDDNHLETLKIEFIDTESQQLPVGIPLPLTIR